MNLINMAVFNRNWEQLSNWVDSIPVSDIIGDLTYNSYEDNNPFTDMRFTKDDIDNKPLRVVANTSSKVGEEVFSFFTNPYYIPHKIIQIPKYYSNAVDLYDKYSINNEDNDNTKKS